MSDYSQAPGWYHAEGDPPGTQRYWDGSAWQGGPQPTQQAATGFPQAESAALGGRVVAAPGKRFVAFLIDWGIGLGIYIVGFILIAVFGAIADALGALMFLITLLAVLGYWVYNLLYLQGTTGQSIGKKQQGITLLRSDNYQPVGAGMAFVRNLLQSIFAIPCYLDHWWILVDENNLRLSDQVLTFHVYDA